MVTYQVSRPQHFRVQFFTLPQQMLSSTHRELEGVELMLKGDLVPDGGNVVYITDNSGSLQLFIASHYTQFSTLNFVLQLCVSGAGLGQ